MKRIAAVVLMMAFSHFTVAGEGIWQDKDNASRYFSIHEQDGRVVVINLRGIETSGSTLQSTYLGETSDYVLTRMEAQPGQEFYDVVQLEFESPDDAVIYPLCDACSVVALRIRKIL